MSTVSEVSPEDWAVWSDYYRAGRELTRAFDKRLLDDAGISHPEYLVMLTLWQAPEHHLRTGELADDLAWEKSRVSHQVTRMVARGLLDRRECATDARGVWVGLTAEGRRTLLRATRDHTTAIREWFFDVLSDEEKHIIQQASQRMRAKLLTDGVAPLPREREASEAGAA
ncbi:MarR family winged helix-turn-helix transcriptional regulator [Protaetiibacter larvae]|uniref:Winged helix-turn-helix transcriptional regulator n=1 Tax=Protaetiibacter larvae TaxID=2592654 RepID=A0A5C1Y7T3_9MICO|nr:MarR family winged helix-turn-helix transcriptional regulator [Protaetiibacter larvae]QEO08982.1 winged helix-turn-helix transcriptional regulator [Protaetiibacter larvae]